jgi:GT2 family glycosyltransferase
MTQTLLPITSPDPNAEIWAGATWVGQVDEQQITGEEITLCDAEGFARARFLVWSDGQPRGFVELPVTDGVIPVATLRAKVEKLPAIAERVDSSDTPPISVAVCTRDRPEQLRDVLKNLIELDYPQFEVLVVDNNPASGLTPPVAESFSDANVRLASAAGQGLSIARNTALNNARFNLVAFTDDDVIVDRNWLRNLAHGFGRNDDVACVCGMVPSAEVATPAQSYFDRRVGWARECEAAVYDLANPPDDDLFPFRVAQYGTGANFAVDKDAVLEIGGFDEGMGIGSPTGGGEDIDMFLRVLLAGRLLVREPSAVVWHEHRRSADELETQIRNYGLGLGAWITKYATRPRTCGMVLRRLRPAIRHLRGVTIVDQSDTIANDPQLDALDHVELRGVLSGPLALARARVQGRQAQPLKRRSTKLMRALDFRRGQMWGAPDNSFAAGRLAAVSVIAGLVGLLGAISVLPSFLLVILVGAYVLVGPGSLVLSWYSHLPSGVLVSLLPALGLAICLLVVTGLLMVGVYNPMVVLLGLSGVTVVGGLLRRVYLARLEVAPTS